jgi:hypothetical protein
MTTQHQPSYYIFSVLAICILITNSLQIYLPVFNFSQGVVGMFFFNILGILIVHHYCNRSNIQEFSLKDATNNAKIIFYCELIILVQLLLFVLLYTFFEIKRETIDDLVLLLLVHIYLFIRGNEYLILDKK